MSSTTYEEYLNQHGSMTYKFKGVSMLPLLRQGRDFYTVKKKTDERCKKYDVVLYYREPGEYVLHRIIKVRDKDYVIRGDNCVNNEYGITDKDILGVMTEYIRDGKKHSVTEKKYIIYSRLWVWNYGLRMFYIKIKRLLKRILRGNS